MTLTPEQQAFADRINKEGEERHAQELAAMTPEDARAIIMIAANILGEHDFVAGEHKLNIVADWLEAQQSKSIKVNTYECKQWLLSLPMEQRQMVIDELTACTLRTLEAGNA